MGTGFEHLSDAQLEDYGTDGVAPDREEEQRLEAHLAECDQCRSRVLEKQRIRLGLLTDRALARENHARQKQSGVTSNSAQISEPRRSPESPDTPGPASREGLVCTIANGPTEDELHDVAAKQVSPEKAKTIIQHCAHCERCAAILQESLEFLEQLKSSTPSWRREMATMAVKANAEEPPAASANKAHAVAPLPTRVFAWPMRRILAPAAIAASALIAFGLWFTQRDTPEKVEKLLAQAYTEHRTIEYRWPGAEWGPLRVKRGPQESVLAAPVEILEAKKMLQDHQAASEVDANWLAARGELELLQGHLQKAIDDLNHAEALGQTSTQTKSILAIAYAQLGNANDDQAAWLKASDLFTELIGADGNDKATALFNRALIYRHLKMNDKADVDWKALQNIEHQSQWETERSLVD